MFYIYKRNFPHELLRNTFSSQLQKLKVFTFIASMTVIASVVNPIIPFMSNVIDETFNGVSDACPLRECVLYSRSYDRNSPFDVQLLKHC